MLPEENTINPPYAPSYQEAWPASVGALNHSAVAPAPATPIMYPPVSPPLPPGGPEVLPPTPVQKRRGRTGAILLLTIVLALIFGAGLLAGWDLVGKSRSSTTLPSQAETASSASSSNSTTIETLQENAIARIEPSVVELDVTTVRGEQLGSGVIIDTKGDIVTNNHVISGGQNIQVTLSNGQTEPAQIIGTDPADDLAVVRIQPFAQMKVAQLGDSSKLVVGQEVLAVGNPLGMTETATRGIVSALNRTVTEQAGTTISHAIQTDAALNPGNSGGALINLQGQLVGIPTLGAINPTSNTTANGISFAIPSNRVTTVIQQLIQQ